MKPRRARFSTDIARTLLASQAPVVSPAQLVRQPQIARGGLTTPETGVNISPTCGHMLNTAKWEVTVRNVLGVLLGAAALLVSVPLHAETSLTIATVNNGDMIRMQGLTSDFTAKNPDITVKWVTL